MKLKSSRKFDAALANPFICYLDLGGGGSAPAPDPAIGAAAQQNSDVAREALDFNKQVYEENKPRQAKSDVIAEQVVADQLAISKQNQSQATSQWDRFQTIFAPVEDRMVKDAMTIDSAAEQERAAGEAGTNVVKSYDAAQKQSTRNLASMGINPNSGRALSATSTLGAMKAADEAGAMNNARQIVKDKGIALRAGAANFGRNMPNTAANAYTTAVGSGNSAMGNQNSTMAAANSNAGQMNQGFGTSINGNNSAMQGLNQQYGNQINAWDAGNKNDQAAFGNTLKTVGMAAALFSSKKIKESKKPVDDADTIEKVKDLPVESWKYKQGVADEGEHIGAYAEDVQKAFGDKAAPGGKAIDVISMHGIQLSAIKGLAKSVDKLEKKVANIAARGIRRA